MDTNFLVAVFFRSTISVRRPLYVVASRFFPRELWPAPAPLFGVERCCSRAAAAARLCAVGSPNAGLYHPLTGILPRWKLRDHWR